MSHRESVLVGQSRRQGAPKDVALDLTHRRCQIVPIIRRRPAFDLEPSGVSDGVNRLSLGL